MSLNGLGHPIELGSRRGFWIAGGCSDLHAGLGPGPDSRTCDLPPSSASGGLASLRRCLTGRTPINMVSFCAESLGVSTDACG